ncbi:MAG: hypothetical protein MZV63_31830 [Marinilabiliales bacterium]|nr:hypothetical protein [Marinilabiliales bacterium]
MRFGNGASGAPAVRHGDRDLQDRGRRLGQRRRGTHRRRRGHLHRRSRPRGPGLGHQRRAGLGRHRPPERGLGQAARAREPAHAHPQRHPRGLRGERPARSRRRPRAHAHLERGPDHPREQRRPLRHPAGRRLAHAGAEEPRARAGDRGLPPRR